MKNSFCSPDDGQMESFEETAMFMYVYMYVNPKWMKACNTYF